MLNLIIGQTNSPLAIELHLKYLHYLLIKMVLIERRNKTFQVFYPYDLKYFKL